MEEKELKALQAEIKAEQAKQSQAVADLKKATEDQKAELFAKYGEAEKKAAELQTAFDQLQAKFGPDSNFGKKEDSFVEMKKSYEGRIKDLKEKNAKPFTFEVKAIMDTATSLSGSGGLATAVVLPFREQGIGKAPDRMPRLLDMVDSGTITSDTLTWIERSARTASAAAVSEGSPYAQSDLTYIQRSQAVERVGHYFKVQNRSLEDWDYLLSEINTEGFTGLERILEEYVYKGTGTTPQIQGITDTGFAAAYTSTALNGQVISPNHFDAVRAAVMQLRLGEYMGNGVFVNPADGAAFELAKTSEGIYVLPPFRAANGQMVAGLPIIESTLVTAGDMLAGDFKKSKLFMRRGIEIKIFEQNENDALYDRKTIVVSCRAANRIKTPDYNAFVYDTFADIISAIAAV